MIYDLLETSEGSAFEPLSAGMPRSESGQPSTLWPDMKKIGQVTLAPPHHMVPTLKLGDIFKPRLFWFFYWSFSQEANIEGCCSQHRQDKGPRSQRCFLSWILRMSASELLSIPKDLHEDTNWLLHGRALTKTSQPKHPANIDDFCLVSVTVQWQVSSAKRQLCTVNDRLYRVALLQLYAYNNDVPWKVESKCTW